MDYSFKTLSAFIGPKKKKIIITRGNGGQTFLIKNFAPKSGR